MRSASSEKRVRLKDLAHFQVRSIQRVASGWSQVEGGFTHLIGVRPSEEPERTVGFLYRSRKDSLYLFSEKKFDPQSGTVKFLTPPTKRMLRPGDSFPYVDYYWSPKQVSFALEPASAWRRVRFGPKDSVRYRDPAVPGWWKSHLASVPVSEGGTDVGIIKGGWDHEHCDFCWSRIGEGGARYGYFSKADNDWLSVRCHREFIAAHDLRFLQFKK